MTLMLLFSIKVNKSIIRFLILLQDALETVNFVKIHLYAIKVAT